MNRTVPELNVPLLEAVSAKIADEPENFYMGDWFCGTTRCIAGHAVELAGYELHEDYDRAWCTRNNAERDIGAAAMEALGLTHGESAHLFYGDHKSVDAARRAIKDLIESRQGGVA